MELCHAARAVRGVAPGPPSASAARVSDGPRGSDSTLPPTQDLLKHTPPGHPDHPLLQDALRISQNFLSSINEEITPRRQSMTVKKGEVSAVATAPAGDAGPRCVPAAQPSTETPGPGPWLGDPGWRRGVRVGLQGCGSLTAGVVSKAPHTSARLGSQRWARIGRYLSAWRLLRDPLTILSR